MAKKHAFLVEDEPILLMMLETSVEALGYEVADTAHTLEGGLRTVNGHARYDFAVLDVNLGDDARSFEIARRLLARGVPVLFVTGYGRQGLEGQFPDCPVVEKPYTMTSLKEGIASAGG